MAALGDGRASGSAHRAAGARQPAASAGAALLAAEDQRRRAGRLLHDEVGPLLSAAGLRLQLLKMDHPASRERVDEALELLDEVMERVRAVSQELNPSVVERAGLRRALEGLAERSGIELRYATDARLPVEAAIALFRLADWAVGQAARARASRVRLSVGGRVKVKLEVRHDGRPRRPRVPLLEKLLARRAGISLEAGRGQGTIVTARYAIRRPAGR